ncbi:hypothetical protein WR25_06877 isoform A [Diploscapter pachys]|uniref:dihydrofolate reductase n=1 Tax=Diploscapter pachys TaxID=2018661 RepID=A0A2A2JNE4_9BILA|nr:hypothetical protein WR25_06877 isoform A [Diploscapter pachys]
MAHRFRSQALIVAMDAEMGIGKGGGLPWQLKHDMQRFMRLTSKTQDPKNKNVIVMGRKCWQSIPEKFRPLKNRINIVLSRTLEEHESENLIICNDISRVSEIVSSLENVEKIWNIGGKEIYQWALDADLVQELYVTKIHKSFETDVKLDGISWENFEEDAEKREGPVTESDTTYTFHINMVNRGKKKSDSSDRSSRAAVRNMAHSNNVNGESAPHNTSNCSSGSRKKSTSGESTEQLQALDPSNDSVFNSLRQDATSVEVQTEKQSDLMINFLALPQEERMSSLCEMLSTIDPLEVRLAAACLEGIRTTQSSQLKHLEIRANTSAAVDNIRNQQLTMENYQKCVDAVYALVTLLTPANRPIAMQYIGCIERLISERIRINPEYTNIADRVKALRLIFRLVSACIHHPAFPGDFRVRMTVVIDDLQQEIWDAQRQIQEANHAGPDAEGESAFQSVSECGAPSSASSFHFINKFEATLAHDDNFCIQMIWNDGERTFARRTRREIFELHHKLLDLFGEERREQTKRSHEDAAASCSGMSDGTRRVSNEVQNAEWERSRTNSNTTTGNESGGKILFGRHSRFLEDIKYRSVK